ncbi:MAG TPA: insulinase family protein, partial [Nocardioides sp.]
MTGPTDGERHGVRARWLDVPGTVVGTLTFGVGAADEPPYLAGITHLAEHLVFRSIGDVGARANGVTGPDTVTFFTTGTAREVADFLEAVAAAVREPRFSADDLVRELHVIRAERPGGESPDLGLLTYRFGLTGPGLAGAGWPALPAITVEEVREWMAHWFVAANAVLTSSAPLPTDLDLRLPIGRSPQRSVPVPIVRAATLVEAPKHGVAASLLVPGEHADVLGACLERELFTELRTRRALVYTVAADTTPVGPDAVHLSLVLDPATVDVPATVELLVTTLRRIAVDGVRAEVLADAVAAVAAARGWWGAPIDELDGWAEATLAG